MHHLIFENFIQIVMYIVRAYIIVASLLSHFDWNPASVSRVVSRESRQRICGNFTHVDQAGYKKMFPSLLLNFRSVLFLV